MADVSVSADGFAGSLEAILEEYGREVSEQLRADVDAAAQTGLEEVRKGAAAHVGRRGKYKDSWRADAVEGAYGYAKVVHSTQPGLPHLLDKGHLLRDGSRYSGDGHVAAAGEAAVREFERRVHG